LKICKFIQIDDLVSEYNSKIKNFNEKCNSANRLNKITIETKSFFSNWQFFKRDPSILKTEELDNLYCELKVFNRKINSKLYDINNKIQDYEERIMSSNRGSCKINSYFRNMNSSSSSSSSSVTHEEILSENDEEIIVIRRVKRQKREE